MIDAQFALRGLWTMVVLLGIWLVVAIPAYAVLSVWAQLRTALGLSVATSRIFVHDVADRMAVTAARIRTELQQRLRWFEIDQTARDAWLQSIDYTMAPAVANAAELTRTRRGAEKSLSFLQPLLVRLKQLRLASQSVPSIPTLRDAQDSTQKSRIGATNFVISSIFLPVIIAANAQMTGLVLSEILPPVRPLLGIPIPLVVAAIVVLAEAAIGVLHSAEAESRADSERTFTLMAGVWMAAGFGVVAIEAMLYGIVQPDNVVKIPVAGSVFGLVGAVLGLTVFGLGRLWHHSLITFRKERTARVVAKHLVSLRHAAEEWNAVAERVTPKQTEAVAHLERLTALATEAANIQSAAVVKAHAAFDHHRAVLPLWASSRERPLSDSEFHERESRVYLWLTILVVANASLAAVSGLSARRVTPLIGVAVGIGVSIASVSLGAFASQAISRSFRWKVFVEAGMAGVVLVLASAAALFLRSELSLHAVVFAIPAVAAFLSGVQIGPDSSLLKLPVWMVARLLVLAILTVLLVVFHGTNLLVALIHYLLSMIAWPITALLTIRRRSSTVEHVPAVI
jgi:hypothetical protein